MSIQAYILIQTEVGKSSSVTKSVTAIAGVTIAESVTGPYDVIMRAEAASMDPRAARPSRTTNIRRCLLESLSDDSSLKTSG